MAKNANMSEELLNEYRRVAYYYYKAGLTQEMIAKRMKMSRQRVNRIVSACVDLGIVKITIDNLDKCNLELETELEQIYKLKDVRIVDDLGEDKMMKELGIAAGEYLSNILQDNDIIGITRGRTTAAMVDNWIPRGDYPKNLTVAQLIGSGKEADSHRGADRIVYELAENIQAKESILHAPVIVHSEELRNSFFEDPYFKDTYDIMKNCTIAVVGIGTANSQWKHMVALHDSLTESQSDWAKDVVGEVCTHFFDKEGKEVIPPFGGRIIAIKMEDYMNIPVKIGVATGDEKLQAIKAALKGGYVNVLITDLQTAEKLKEWE